MNSWFYKGQRWVWGRSINNSFSVDHYLQASFAAVDIIPLFLQTVSEAPIVDDKDLIVSCNTSNEGDKGSSVPLIHIQHIPTGICVQSSGNFTGGFVLVT